MSEGKLTETLIKNYTCMDCTMNKAAAAQTSENKSNASKVVLTEPSRRRYAASRDSGKECLRHRTDGGWAPGSVSTTFDLCLTTYR